MHHSIWKILFVLVANEYLERLEGKIRKCLFFYVKIFYNNIVILVYIFAIILLCTYIDLIIFCSYTFIKSWKKFTTIHVLMFARVFPSLLVYYVNYILRYLLGKCIYYFYILLPEFGCMVVVGVASVGSFVLWAEKPNAKFSVLYRISPGSQKRYNRTFIMVSLPLHPGFKSLVEAYFDPSKNWKKKISCNFLVQTLHYFQKNKNKKQSKSQILFHKNNSPHNL